LHILFEEPLNLRSFGDSFFEDVNIAQRIKKTSIPALIGFKKYGLLIFFIFISNHWFAIIYITLSFNRVVDMSAARILFAQYLRGIACLMVMIFHLAGVFWLWPAAAGLANTPVYNGTVPSIVNLVNPLGIINWGAVGVGLFFLISGFVIPLSLQKKDSIQFLIGRFFRIFPTYAVGFSISICALGLAGWYYARNFVYPIQIVLLNYLLLWDVFTGVSIDGAAWTLVIELKFYIICAMIIFWLRKADWQKILFLCVALFVGLRLILDNIIPSTLGGISLYFYEFDVPFLTFMFIGTMLYFYHYKKISLKETIFSIIVLSGLFMVSSAEGAGQAPLPPANGYFIGMGIFIACFAYSQLKDKIPLKMTWNPGVFILTKAEGVLAFMADISYPLYIIHGITNYVLMRILLDIGFSPYIVLLIGISDSILIALFLHTFIEIPSNDFGKKIASRVDINSVIQGVYRRIDKSITLVLNILK